MECSQLFGSNGIITSDGSAISVTQNCGTTWITLDTNGLKKNPNAYGHDVFLFEITKTGKLYPASGESEGTFDKNGNWIYNNTPENIDKCNPQSPSSLNGITCGRFALANVCPDNPKKTYWECLP